MPIPVGSAIVKHSLSSYHLAVHELGLIQTTAGNDGKQIEVQIYKKEVDADKSGSIEKDRETLDADGNGNIQPIEVWEFFTRNMFWLTKDGVGNVINTLCEQINSSSHPLPPESKIFKAYLALFTKALESEDADIRAKGKEALNILYRNNSSAKIIGSPAPSVQLAQPTQSCKTTLLSLPAGAVAFEVIRGIDGDTIAVVPQEQYCKGKEHRKTGEKECSIRLNFNTTEKVKSVKKAKEEYSLEATEEMEALLPEGGIVYLVPRGQDHFGRMLSAGIYIEKTQRETGRKYYIDIAAYMIQKGLAHVYFVQDSVIERNAQLLCQAEAKRNGLNIWDPATSPHFTGNWHITSQHCNGTSSENLKCTGENEPPNCEYIRIVSIADGPMDLGQYFIENCDTGEKYRLPHNIFQPGLTLKIYSGEGADQLDPVKGDMAVYLGRKKQFWDDQCAVPVVRHESGAVQDWISSRKHCDCTPK